ncbi:hypothetical protein E2C01_094641 [Portunus trituberculatus]|uniref:Uncharacterized protein n=1 Tax=Portunus trituberculatus TaxID=210409 RepID=A0A5B7JWN5_PORTR|nr:hypothetical protein [Portunus trituberculatus]
MSKVTYAILPSHTDPDQVNQQNEATNTQSRLHLWLVRSHSLQLLPATTTAIHTPLFPFPQSSCDTYTY